MPAIITEASSEHINDLILLGQKSIRELCRKDYNAHQINAWANRINNPERFAKAISEQFFIIASVNQQIAAFGSLKEGHYIDFLFCDPSFARMGLSSQILQGLTNQATAQSTKKLSTHASKTATPFFLSRGFSVEKNNIVRIGQVELTNYCMTKAL